MRVLVDTNVVLDVLMARKPHVEHAVAVFALVEAGRLRGVLGATAVTTVFYLAAKAVGAVQARAHTRTILELFEVAPVDRKVLIGALDAGFEDFDDGVLYEAGRAVGVDAIITRDSGGFVAGTLPVFTPESFLAAVTGDASDA